MPAYPLSVLHRDDVDMIMKHGLASGCAVGLKDTDTVWCKRCVHCPSNALNYQRYRRKVNHRDFKEVGRMDLWNHQCMAGTGGLDIHEGDRMLALMHPDRWDVSSDDAAEDAVGMVRHGGNSL